jgi:hypothetical protein
MATAKKGRKTMKAANAPAKRPRKRATKTPARSPKKAPERPRKVTGTVLKIVNGKPTEERLSAQEAFSDPAQAIEQVLYAERHGSREELKLVRLGYRQYQQKRFRSK